MTFTKAELNSIRKEGFLVLSGYRPQKVTLEIFEALKSVVSEGTQAYNTDDFYESHGAVNFTFDNPHLVNSVLHEFSKELKSIAEYLMSNSHFHMSLIQHNKSSLSHNIPWHQDISYTAGAGNFYNFLFYPQTADELMGGLKLVPKSHLSGKLTLGGGHDELIGEVMVYPKAGDLIIVDGLTFHAVPTNHSKQDRYSYCTRYISEKIVGSKALDIGHYRTGSYDYAKKESVDYA
jgi:ectoine hydroxylase-related dioxygenase (phytanoyl-CoA dioxygenase family)